MNRISILTPCFNSEKYIEETLLSILNNYAVLNKSVHLEYILCDGGSSDDTVAIAERTLKNNMASNITFTIISEKDEGMYDALSKGLLKVSGDVCAYLNAADLYSPFSLGTVSKAFAENKEKIRWLTGRAVIYSSDKVQVFNRLPYKYRSNLIQCGMYGSYFPHIQQESTFWVSELIDHLDLSRFRKFKLAGDLFLWSEFSKHTQLNIINTWLGGYRHHEGALSTDIHSYEKEVSSFILSPTEKDYMQAENDKRFWDMSDDLKVRWNSDSLFYYDRARDSFIT
ncbi:MAG: glycosyltransferase [Paraglaciecola sp.]|uniref:glycosyltransferase n=1 Tax=Paraglaciecola sp. TaxID=1920173 RepID=UPI00329835E8